LNESVVHPGKRESHMKTAIFIGSSLRDLRRFPEEARAEAGHAIYLAQKGEKAINAVPLTGFGGSTVLEVVIPEGRRVSGGLYREVRYGRLRASRVPEEVQEGHQDAPGGYEPDPLSPEGCAGHPPGDGAFDQTGEEE
jgi:hypothetical protein